MPTKDNIDYNLNENIVDILGDWFMYKHTRHAYIFIYIMEFIVLEHLLVLWIYNIVLVFLI